MKLLLFALVEVVGSLVFPEIQGWTNVTLVDEPFLPTVKELGDMEAPETAARWQFWVLVMLSIGGVTALTGTLILKRAERPEEAQAEAPEGRTRSYALVASVPREHDDDRAIERSGVAFKPRTLKVLLAMSLTMTFSTSFAALVWSSRTGRLSKDYGADWEVYAGLLACSGLALVVQALIMARRLPPGEKFGTTAFAQACIAGMAPVISDQYDTMKDIMFGLLCMDSEHVEIQAMGVFSLLWLVGVHVVCFAYEDTTAELLSSHLAVLLLTPDTGAAVAFRDELLVLLYKQLTPTKRKLLLSENVPQAIFAIIFLSYEGGSIVVTVLSLAIPALQIGLAFLLYGAVRAQVAPYFGRRLRALIRAGDQLLAQRLWGEADFESDKGLFRQAVAFMHSKEIGAERDDDVISLWKVALAMHDGPSKEQEHWDLSDLGLKEELPLVEAFFAELAAAECQKLGVDLSHNQLGAESAGALARAIGKLVELQKLTLSLKGNKLRDAGTRTLATVFSSLLQLQDLSLNLEMNDLGEEGALSLLEALRATRPAAGQLDLGDCDIGKGAVALARALRSGEVSCRVTHPVVEMLLREEFKDEEAGKLELGLSSKEDLGPLCQALPLLRLREVELRLADLELGEEGALSLLEALRATSPASTQLYLGDCAIGKGAFALARALRSGEVKGQVAHPIVEFLVELELSDRQLKELEEERKLELFLRYDTVRFRRLFEPLCRALRRGQQPPLRELELRLYDLGDAFGDDQGRGLALGLQQQKELQGLMLDLSSNSLGPEGAEAVACAIGELTELKKLELHLQQTKIRDAGAASVATSLRKLRQLTELRVFLPETGLSKEQQKKLQAAFDALPVAEKRIRL